MSLPFNFDPEYPDIRLKDRLEGSFQDMPSLIEALGKRGMGFRQTDPTLKLPPQKPAMPKMFQYGEYNYPYSMPESNPNYAWVANRDNLEGNWQKIGSPITKDLVGNTTFNQIGGEGTFQPQHHGANIPQETRFSDDELRNNLQKWNLPTDGNREQLFERNIRVKNHPTYLKNLMDGKQNNTAEVQDVMGNNPQYGSMQEALKDAQSLRTDRQNAGYYENVQNPISASPNLNQTVERTIGTGSNPMTINNMPGASQAARNVAQGAGAAEAATGVSTFASRAMPMVNLALLAGSMLQNSKANTQQKEDEQRQRSMAT